MPDILIVDHNETRAYIVMIATIVGTCIYFHSAWVRGGYTGKDKILDLFETNRLYIHVAGMFIVLTFEQMVFSTKDFATAAWIIVGSILGGIFGIEVYMDSKKILDRIKRNRDKEDHLKEE